MCLGGGGSTKVDMPKPQPLPPPPAPPPPPPPPKPESKPLVKPDQKVDIRIGQAKTSSGQRNRGTVRQQGKQSLSIGNNQGMNL